MKIICVFALLVAVCVSSSSAIRCYNCVLPGEPKCEDAKGLSGEDCGELNALEKVGGIKNVCLKNVITAKGAKQITRSCFKQVPGLNACTAAGELVDHCSVCETDLCNKSAFVLASIWSVALPAVAIMFNKLF